MLTTVGVYSYPKAIAVSDLHEGSFIYKTKTINMNFGLAFEQVKLGKSMRLPKWSEDVTIKAQFPDENNKMTAPYLYVESRFGLVPWKETMIELFSEEWLVVD